MTRIRSIAFCSAASLTLLAACSRPAAAPPAAAARQASDKPAPAVVHATTAAAVTASQDTAGTPQLPPGHPPLTGGAASAPPATPIAPAKGGSTIEAVWKTRDALAGKSVTVRGKVVKFTGGVLGVNWIHLQDGTGSAADGTNDVTVTSDADARVGEIVTITGTVGLNKDLGSGYNYPVIIEHAKIVERSESLNR